MKKEVILRIVIDTERDAFAINTDTKGFDEKTPTQNSLLIASMLKVAYDQELAIFRKGEGKN